MASHTPLSPIMEPNSNLKPKRTSWRGKALSTSSPLSNILRPTTRQRQPKLSSSGPSVLESTSLRAYEKRNSPVYYGPTIVLPKQWPKKLLNNSKKWSRLRKKLPSSEQWGDTIQKFNMSFSTLRPRAVSSRWSQKRSLSEKAWPQLRRPIQTHIKPRQWNI